VNSGLGSKVVDGPSKCSIRPGRAPAGMQGLLTTAPGRNGAPPERPSRTSRPRGPGRLPNHGDPAVGPTPPPTRRSITARVRVMLAPCLASHAEIPSATAIARTTCPTRDWSRFPPATHPAAPPPLPWFAGLASLPRSDRRAPRVPKIGDCERSLIPHVPNFPWLTTRTKVKRRLASSTGRRSLMKSPPGPRRTSAGCGYAMVLLPHIRSDT
jgi:hypothetical protein